MYKLVVNLSIVPKIEGEQDYKTVIDFFKMLKERFIHVAYSIPNEQVLERLGKYRNSFTSKLVEIGYHEHNLGNKKTPLFLEEGERSIEYYVGRDERFKKFAKLYLRYFTKFHKSDHKHKLHIYKKTMKRLGIEVKELEGGKGIMSIKEKPIKNSDLYIHLDFANFFPMRINNWHDLKLWTEFISSLIPLIKRELNYTGRHEVITYLEGYFKPTIPKDYERLEYFVSRFRNEASIENVELTVHILTVLLNMLGFKYVVPPKEAEQAIPDKIAELKQTNPNAMHVIVSDDKARDTTECDLRVVYYESTKKRVLSRGKAKKVVSLEYWAPVNPFVKWFLKGDSVEPNLQTVKGTEEELKKVVESELDTFPLFTNTDKTRLILEILGIYRRDPEKFKDFWMNLSDNNKDKLFEGLKNYNNRIFKRRLLLVLFEAEEDRKDEVLYFIKEMSSESKDMEIIYERLKSIHEEEDLRMELETLKRVHDEKIRLKQQIDSLRKEIKNVENIAKDGNISELRRKELQKELSRRKEYYKSLKAEIKSLEDNIEKIKKDVQRLNNLRQELKESIRNMEARKESLQKHIDKERKRKATLSQDIEQLEDRLSELRRAVSDISENKSKISSEIKRLSEKKESLDNELNKENERLENIKEELIRLEERIRLIKGQIEDKKDIIRQREGELRDFETVKETYDKLRALDDMKKYISYRKEDLESLDSNIAQLEEEKRNIEAEIESAKESYDNVKAEVESKKEILNKLKRDIEIAGNEVKALNEEIRELEGLKEDEEKLRRELRSRRDSLQEYERIYKDNPEIIKDIKRLIEDIDAFLKNLPE